MENRTQMYELIIFQNSGPNLDSLGQQYINVSKFEKQIWFSVVNDCHNNHEQE